VVVAGSALLGLLVGSVLNVVIDRVPDRAPLRGRRDGEPREPVSWLGVPAQPWVLRQGWRHGAALPARWLWVELATVVVFVELAVRYGDSWTLAPLLLLGACLVAVSAVDLMLLRIPDRITFPTLAAAVPSIVLVSLHQEVPESIRAALVGAGAYFLLLLVTHLLYPSGMGFGDVKLAVVMGLYLGWLGWTEPEPILGPLRLVLYALMLGCILGVLFGLATRVLTRAKGAFPFGPALAAACLVVVLFAADLRS